MQSGWILQAQSSLVPDLLPVLTVFTSWRICFRFKNDITLCCVFLYSGRELVSICYLLGNFSVSIDSTGMLIWRQSRFTKMVQGINGHTSFWLTVLFFWYKCNYCILFADSVHLIDVLMQGSPIYKTFVYSVVLSWLFNLCVLYTYVICDVMVSSFFICTCSD
jgi:hypothetical protein